ncbi:MAG TPA: AAA family ATPase, partial [Polyangiaceae bacterium]|nr:AAA family ATPase [Polyangiaceae bacterium]
MTQEASFDVVAQEGRELTADPKATGEKTFGRQEEVRALARTLASGRSAVLVGPSGVGKTAVVQKLLSYLAEGRLPELAGAKIYEISTVGLCADTRFTGQQEGRIRAMLAHASRKRLHYIPDVWNLPYAGSYSTNPRGIYDLMRPGIEQGKLVLFGEATPGRWDKLTREHPVLLRDFVAIAVPETTEEQTRDLLMRVAADISPAFEKQAIDRVFSLAKKFLPTQSFPGKGVELLRRVAQEARAPMMEHAGVATARAAPIDASFVEEVFAKQTGLPMHMLSPAVRISYEEMHRFLSERVLGQKEAVSAVADLLALYKTGLNDPERPAGVLLFVGPTGVGKTELAKATAEFLFGTRDKMLRVDVSEYKDFHSFEKLIGDPKQNKTGLLTDYVRKNPFCVVLLDEFEKGHANLADLMLQVTGDGRLTDAFGDTVDFRHTIIILTSNVGSNLREHGAGIGFAGRAGDAGSPKELARDVRRSLEHAYRPEFLNRIDKILVFSPLEKGDMRRIAQRELGKVYRREGLLERDLLLEVDDGVIDLLLDRGFDPSYGARPLKRAMEELIVLPLARAVLGAPNQRYQLLRVARKGDGVALSFEETESSRKLQNLERRTRVDDGEGHVLRMSLAEVKAALKTIYERLARLEEKADLPAMRTELEAVEEKAKSPAFWDEAFGKGGDVYRRHRLTVELRRLEDLRERTDLLQQLVEASFLEAEDAVASELVGKYARLERQLTRAEREVVHFDETDRGDAQLTVHAVGGKEGSNAWAKELAQMYGSWAEERKYDVEVTVHASHAEVVVKGPYAYGYLKGESGGHRLIAAPKGKGQRRGDVFLARVEVKPLAQRGSTIGAAGSGA